jgi:hypothetical protein
MREQLFHLWNNYEMLKFLEGERYIRNREHQICECLTERQRILFIELQRFDYIILQYVI